MRNPRKGEYVFDQDRDKRGIQPLGCVIWIDFREEEIGVKFFGGDDGIKLPPIAKLLTPQWFTGGDYESYSFDDFGENYSSHEFGDGMWIIN